MKPQIINVASSCLANRRGNAIVGLFGCSHSENPVFKPRCQQMAWAGCSRAGCRPLAGVLLGWEKSSWPLCGQVCTLIRLLCLACSSRANPDLQRHGHNPVDEGHRLALQSCGGPRACGEVDERQVTSNPMCAFSGALRCRTRDTELGPLFPDREEGVRAGPRLQH